MADSHSPPERRAKAKARIAAATAGPWRVSRGHGGGGDVRVQTKANHTQLRLLSRDITPGALKSDYTEIDGREGWSVALRDFDFIAHARADLPDALAEIERLEAENAALRAELEDRRG